MIVSPALLFAFLCGEPLVQEQASAASSSASPLTAAEAQRVVFEARVRQYLKLADEVGAELLTGDLDDTLAALLDDERMTTYLGLGGTLSRDIGRAQGLQELAAKIDELDHGLPEGPIFRRPEVIRFMRWLELLMERFDSESLLTLNLSLPAPLSSPSDVGREVVHLLYDPALPSGLRRMLYAGVRISARSAVLLHARTSDIDDDIVARVFAGQDDDLLEFEQLIAFGLLQAGLPASSTGRLSLDELAMLREQLELNRTQLDGWLAEGPAAQG